MGKAGRKRKAESGGQEQAMVTIEPISNFEGNAGSFKGGRNSGAKKAGRPAHEGERYPSGKLKPAEKQSSGTPPAQIKRLFDAALRGAADPLYGTALGFLFLNREITAQELAAGVAYAKLRGRYDRAVGVPGRFTLSPDYGTARSLSSQQPMTDAEVEAVKKRQADTFAAIDAEMHAAWCVPDGRGGLRWVSPEGQLAQKRTTAERRIALLERVCVDDLACERFEVERLKCSLQILVPWFGISH